MPYTQFKLFPFVFHTNIEFRTWFLRSPATYRFEITDKSKLVKTPEKSSCNIPVVIPFNKKTIIVRTHSKTTKREYFSNILVQTQESSGPKEAIAIKYLSPATAYLLEKQPKSPAGVIEMPKEEINGQTFRHLAFPDSGSIWIDEASNIIGKLKFARLPPGFGRMSKIAKYVSLGSLTFRQGYLQDYVVNLAEFDLPIDPEVFDVNWERER